jgi:hypothetical protein
MDGSGRKSFSFLMALLASQSLVQCSAVSKRSRRRNSDASVQSLALHPPYIRRSAVLIMNLVNMSHVADVTFRRLLACRTTHILVTGNSKGFHELVEWRCCCTAAVPVRGSIFAAGAVVAKPPIMQTPITSKRECCAAFAQLLALPASALRTSTEGHWTDRGSLAVVSHHLRSVWRG